MGISILNNMKLAIVLSFIMPALAVMAQEKEKEVLVTTNNVNNVDYYLSKGCIELTKDLPGGTNILRCPKTGFPLVEMGDTVEANSKVSLTESDPSKIVAARNPRLRSLIVQSWGLDRMDQADKNLNGNFNPGYNGGEGVNVYIIDTGVEIEHRQFQGRAKFLSNHVTDEDRNDDCNGHGTHVAGTVASKDYGVAKKATIYAVRVLKCDGTGVWGDVVSGINAAVAHAKANNPKRSIINISVGGSEESAKVVADAVKAATESGIHVVAAAGNDVANACNVYPANVGSVITVGSTDQTDARSWFSNWGNCLDINAPGSLIISTYPGNRAAEMSGTSMAAPHVAGAAALLLGEKDFTVSAMADKIRALSTDGVLTGLSSSTPNKMLKMTQADYQADKDRQAREDAWKAQWLAYWRSQGYNV